MLAPTTSPTVLSQKRCLPLAEQLVQVGFNLDDWKISSARNVLRGRYSLVSQELTDGRPSIQPRMSNEEPIQVEGTIATVLPGTMFRVKLDNQHELLAHLSGKMRKHFVRLTVGDRVRLEMSPYDLTKARITYRLK
jgi:translation initiation factor IF-1